MKKYIHGVDCTFNMCENLDYLSQDMKFGEKYRMKVEIEGTYIGFEDKTLNFIHEGGYEIYFEFDEINEIELIEQGKKNQPSERELKTTEKN